MKRLLYPLIASALITIAPFLITFENGQDIVRGLFGYSELALLLIFVWVRTSLDASTSLSMTKKVLRIVALVLIIAVMLVVAFMDLSNLLAIKGWDMEWRAVVPIATCGLAVAMMWKIPAFSFPTINLIMFVSLVFHLAAYNYYPAQPVAQFPVVEYLARTAPKSVERKVLPEEFKAKYEVVDTAIVTPGFLDTTRSNVLVLVESWGIPLDHQAFESELSLLRAANAPMKVGVHSRMYSRTRTAEREDLVYSLARDSVTRRRDTTFTPNVLSGLGYETYFFFAGDSTVQWRHKYIRNIGFENVHWGLDSDADAVRIMDSVLTAAAAGGDSAQGRKVFVAWTTSESKFPLKGEDPYRISMKDLEELYPAAIEKTLKRVADLARKHPDVRFIVQGDHEPILSPLPFQERFYKRWTPYVVLN
ncbi:MULTISPECIES: hypothetical protein [unclassified Fibrobacter]|uniref:hypothetical protein n=1 Tax=unclassified Fibrobacter TaxID=2634177 RepID=UPI000D6D0B52|nr:MULTISPECIES: hypothetical protein [unclassified Fibrobacter]PWJ63048.1 hypothetical protein BGX12_11949 [Fibrobacter sp. UWR4]PZW68219.1 hypothetical protein C8E88_101949 [Fibrobacter sp. UWR1]